VTKADKLREWALSKVGSPYVMGGTGKPCTPAYRKARAAQYPDSAAGIKKYCPVLSGKQTGCGGCKYNGKKCYDCAQLVRWGCDAAGIGGMNISGATAQWQRGDFAQTGGIGTLPEGKACILYRGNGAKKQHTGIALGDGTVVHAKGTAYGVVRDQISAGKWTDWAIPIDLTGESDMEATYGTLKKGDMGLGVMHLQTLLMQKGYALIRYGADGKFGVETETAVRDYQAAQGLQVTGACDEATWIALEGRETTQDAPSVDNDALKAEARGLLKRLGAILDNLS